MKEGFRDILQEVFEAEIDASLGYPKNHRAVTNQSVYYPDGRLKEAVGGGITYQYDYTANGQLRSKSSTGKSLLEYAYDRNGNITELKDLTGAVTRYTYDSMNQLLQTGDAKDA